MRKIILNLAVSLDGFIEGPNGAIDWCQMDDQPDSGSVIASHFDQFLSGIDAIFYGRVSYDLWGQYQPDVNASVSEKKLWQQVHSKSKFVFTTNRSLNDGKAVFIYEDVYKNVMKIKDQPGKNIWLYGGANLITAFINSGLIDNYLLAVHPVILGGGKPLFSNVNRRENLKLRSVTSSGSDVLLIDYESVKPGLTES